MKVVKEERCAPGIRRKGCSCGEGPASHPCEDGEEGTLHGGTEARAPTLFSIHLFYSDSRRLLPPTCSSVRRSDMLKHTQTRRGLMHRAARSTTAIVVSRHPPPPRKSLSRGGERDAASAPGLPLLSLYTT